MRRTPTRQEALQLLGVLSALERTDLTSYVRDLTGVLLLEEREGIQKYYSYFCALWDMLSNFHAPLNQAAMARQIRAQYGPQVADRYRAMVAAWRTECRAAERNDRPQ